MRGEVENVASQRACLYRETGVTGVIDASKLFYIAMELKIVLTFFGTFGLSKLMFTNGTAYCGNWQI